MSQLPDHLRQSLTWDGGTELARYDKIQLELDMPVYFWTRTHPGSAAPTRTPTGCSDTG